MSDIPVLDQIVNCWMNQNFPIMVFRTLEVLSYFSFNLVDLDEHFMSDDLTLFYSYTLDMKYLVNFFKNFEEQNHLVHIDLALDHIIDIAGTTMVDIVESILGTIDHINSPHFTSTLVHHIPDFDIH
jgi:hypothetical protein